MHRESLRLGKVGLAPIMEEVKKLSRETLPALGQELREAGAPWIEGLEWPDK